MNVKPLLLCRRIYTPVKGQEQVSRSRSNGSQGVCVGMGAWIGGIIFTPKLLVSYLLSTGTWNSSFSMTIPSSSSSPPVVGMGGAG